MRREGDVVELHRRRQAAVAHRILATNQWRVIEGNVGHHISEEACKYARMQVSFLS